MDEKGRAVPNSEKEQNALGMTAGKFDVDYRPRFPGGYRPGIGIVGCGGIVRQAHLPAYNKYGLRVVGAHDVRPEATEGVQERFGVERVYEGLDELLSDPEIEIVDVATHPQHRAPLVLRALEAGKHVLSQKPFATDLTTARALIAEADRSGLRLAVNQNGRWAPAWRTATLLVQQGVVGEVLAVTHLYEVSFSWTVGTAFDQIEHFAIYDYSIHWLDIIRCWIEGRRVGTVRARDYRTPDQPPEARTPWGMVVEVACEDGASALVRGVGCVRTARVGHPFWIHGTEGNVRGSSLGNDFVELERGGEFRRYDLEGAWFPDGFAGAMGELMSAVAEDREPYNSARHNLLSLAITLAACESADRGGAPVELEGGLE